MTDSTSNTELVRPYLLGLQQRITDRIAAIDGKEFLADAWERKGATDALQGDGLTKILENGQVFERAGCGFSHVRGARLPTAATQHRPELAGLPFEAMGVSLVFDPPHPYVPPGHLNGR
ncbi:MAG: coproporphyrinogen III oxidase, partial [Hylemonella sp.]